MHTTSRLSNAFAGNAARAPVLAAAIAATATLATPAPARDAAFEGRITAVSLGAEMSEGRSVNLMTLDGEPAGGGTGDIERMARALRGDHRIVRPGPG